MAGDMAGDMATWSTKQWRAEAVAWVTESLADAGRTITGPIEQPRVRPWGTVLQVQ